MSVLSPAAATLPARDLARLIVASSLIALPFWMVPPLAAIRLSGRGVDPWLVGLFGAMPYLALISAATVTPRLVGRLGAMPAFAGGVALMLAAVAGFAAADHLATWFAANLVLGAGFALVWVVADSLVAGLARPERRGRVVGLYETVASAAIGAGPLILVAVGTDGVWPFALAGGLAMLGLILIAGLRAPPLPVATGRSLAGLADLARRCPSVPIAAFLCGLLEGAAVGVLPVYGLSLGLAPETAAAMVTAVGFGNLLAQYPLGRLADRIGAVRVLAGAGLASLAGLLTLKVAVGAGSFAIHAVLFAWGGAAGALYTLAVIRAGAVVPVSGLLAAVAAVAATYNFGSLAGPPLGGLAQSLYPAFGLPAVLALASAAGLVLIVVTEHAGDGPRRPAAAAAVDAQGEKP
jgi:MFS family permease